MYVRFKIRKYDNTGDNSWSESYEEVSAYDVQVTNSIGSNKDGFNFKVDNVNDDYNRVVKPMDLVEIHYCINGDVPSADNLVINGLIKKVSLQSNGKSRFLRVEGVSFSDVMTEALVFYNPADQTQNVMQFLESCLNSIRVRDQGFVVTWDESNPTITSNGESFPVFTETNNRVRAYNKTMNKLLDKYLTNEYTGDGSFYWYVSTENKLVIRKRYTSKSDLSLSQSEDFESLKVRINTDDVKNYIIVKCGSDLNNNPISAVFDDVASRAKNGFRYHMIVDVNIAKNIKLANPSDSNAEIISKVKADGRAVARSYAELHNQGYLVISGQTKPRLDVTIAGNVSLTVFSYADYNKKSGNVNDKLMRVQSVQYTVSGLLVELKEEAKV